MGNELGAGATEGARGVVPGTSLRAYLSGLGAYPLLTGEDEVRLARLIETGRHAAALLG